MAIANGDNVEFDVRLLHSPVHMRFVNATSKDKHDVVLL